VRLHPVTELGIPAHLQIQPSSQLLQLSAGLLGLPGATMTSSPKWPDSIESVFEKNLF